MTGNGKCVQLQLTKKILEEKNKKDIKTRTTYRFLVSNYLANKGVHSIQRIPINTSEWCYLSISAVVCSAVR